MKQTICVISLLSLFKVHMVISQTIQQLIFVSYITNMHLACFVILPVNKVDTIC